MNISDYIFINNKIDNDNQLFCKDSTISLVKNMMLNEIEIPIIIHGLEGIGKKKLIFHMLKYLPNFREDNMYINIEKLKLLDIEQYSNLYYYNNVYFYNCKYEKNDKISKLIDNINKIFKSKLFIDSKKIFIMSNFDKLSKNNQLKLSNYVEKYYQNVSFIFTTSSLVKSDNKLKSLSFIIKYIPLNKNEFVTSFCNNFNMFFEDSYNLLNKDFFLDKFYQIYVNNEYNIGNTLHQINYLYLKEYINKKELNKKINILSIYETISIKLVNILLKYKKIKDLSIIRKKIFDINVMGLNLFKIVKIMIKNLINIDNLDSNLKYEFIDFANKYNLDNVNCDKPIIMFENFIIKLWIKLNNF